MKKNMKNISSLAATVSPPPTSEQQPGGEQSRKSCLPQSRWSSLASYCGRAGTEGRDAGGPHSTSCLTTLLCFLRPHGGMLAPPG